jgi:hypothetical protein
MQSTSFTQVGGLVAASARPMNIQKAVPRRTAHRCAKVKVKMIIDRYERAEKVRPQQSSGYPGCSGSLRLSGTLRVVRE